MNRLRLLVVASLFGPAVDVVQAAALGPPVAVLPFRDERSAQKGLGFLAMGYAGMDQDMFVPFLLSRSLAGHLDKAGLFRHVFLAVPGQPPNPSLVNYCTQKRDRKCVVGQEFARKQAEEFDYCISGWRPGILLTGAVQGGKSGLRVSLAARPVEAPALPLWEASFSASGLAKKQQAALFVEIETALRAALSGPLASVRYSPSRCWSFNSYRVTPEGVIGGLPPNLSAPIGWYLAKVGVAATNSKLLEVADAAYSRFTARVKAMAKADFGAGAASAFGMYLLANTDSVACVLRGGRTAEFWRRTSGSWSKTQSVPFAGPDGFVEMGMTARDGSIECFADGAKLLSDRGPSSGNVGLAAEGGSAAFDDLEIVPEQ